MRTRGVSKSLTHSEAYKYKLYQADRNCRLDRQRIVACQIWNHSIALHRRYYRMWGKHLNQSRLKRHIAFLRKYVRPEWQALGSQSVQDVERIDKAYKRFFDWCKKRTGRRVSPPKFRKRARYKSFTLKQAGWRLLSDERIQVGRYSYKLHNSRPIDGDIKTVTLSRDVVGDWWVVFSIVQQQEAPVSRAVTGKTAGLDFGMTTFITLHTGETIKAPQPLLRLLKTLKSASRKVSRKHKGSNSRRRAIKNLARLHRRIANQRLDWMHKTARSLAQIFDVICIEELALEGMKRLWGRKVSDIAWHQFTSILSWHCLKAGSKLVKVDRFYPSSKLCSVCVHLHEGLELRDRFWTCPHCGALHNRDGNAAVNIHCEGLRLFAEKHNFECGHVLRVEAA